MSRSSDFGVILWPRLTTQYEIWLVQPNLGPGSGIFGTFIVHHGGATVRDLHPIPYSPLTVIRGTLSCYRAFALQVFKEPKPRLRRCPKLARVGYSVTRDWQQISLQSRACNRLHPVSRLS